LEARAKGFSIKMDPANNNTMGIFQNCYKKYSRVPLLKSQ